MCPGRSATQEGCSETAPGRRSYLGHLSPVGAPGVLSASLSSLGARRGFISNQRKTYDGVGGRGDNEKQKIKGDVALAHVAQWTERQLEDWTVAVRDLAKGTYLGGRFHPRHPAGEATNQCFYLSLRPSLPLSENQRETYSRVRINTQKIVVKESEIQTQAYVLQNCFLFSWAFPPTITSLSSPSPHPLSPRSPVATLGEKYQHSHSFTPHSPS